jgi:prepilin-type N-terminal cleavage/methylation domain-containing protein
MVRHARKGFTLVELLVVVAIISLLIAMLLPAIQAARESGRRAACSSNLKQLATAVHVFHERHNSMPTYYGWYPDKASYGTGARGSWYVHLMPVMEQQSSYQIIWDTQAQSGMVWGQAQVALNPPADGSTTCYKTQNNPTCSSGSYSCKQQSGSSSSSHNGHSWDHSSEKCGCWSGSDYVGDSTNNPVQVQVPCGTPVMQNVGIASDPVKMTPSVLFCASDPGQPANSISWKYSQTYALTNYQANFNAFSRGKNFDQGKPQSFGAITDGLSQTALFAEGHRQCDRYGDNWGVRVAVYALEKWHNFGIDWSKTPNTLMFQDRPTTAKCDNWRVQANHGGALLVALGDSSVRGISSKISRREVSDPDNPAPGANPDRGEGNPMGNWDRLLLPDDGGAANLE